MEEAVQAIRSILLGGDGFVAIILVTVIAARLLATLGSAFDFHDRNFVSRRINRLQELRPSCREGHPLTAYIDEAIELETFRIASGVATSPAKMYFLLELAQSGQWEQNQLRALSKFIKINKYSLEPEISVDILDKFGALTGLISATLCVLYGAVAAIQLTIKLPPYGILIGVAIFTAFILAARLFGRDFISYRTAKRALSNIE